MNKEIMNKEVVQKEVMKTFGRAFPFNPGRQTRQTSARNPSTAARINLPRRGALRAERVCPLNMEYKAPLRCFPSNCFLNRAFYWNSLLDGV